MSSEDTSETSVFQLGRAPWMKRFQTTENDVLARGNDAHTQGSTGSDDTPRPQRVVAVEKFEEKTEEIEGARVRTRQQEEETQQYENRLLWICKFYFWLGCLGLPLLHFVNVAYFFREIKGHDSNPYITTYAWLSLSVAAFWVLLSIAWFTAFRLHPRLQSLSIEHVPFPPLLA